MDIIHTDLDTCTGCNRCTRVCPIEMANVTYQTEDGDIKVLADNSMCIGCGRCFYVCRHNSRHYRDDAQNFFLDLANGVDIALIVAPSIRTNIPFFKRVFTWLKNLGVKLIYDVAIGADICIWAHVKHIQNLRRKGEVPRLITQPCPVVVKYAQIYQHGLLGNLSPAHSPMACLAIYMRKILNLESSTRIAALSPCIAKSYEFKETGLISYNVTFQTIMNYIEELNGKREKSEEIKKLNLPPLPDNETEYDHIENGLGRLFPRPGGLRDNINYNLRRIGEKPLSVDCSEGQLLFEMLDLYSKSNFEDLPEIFDVLNCDQGCNSGTAAAASNFFRINRKMDGVGKINSEIDNYYEALYKRFEENLNLEDFMRVYNPVFANMTRLTDVDIEVAYSILGKDDDVKRHVDCGACGNNTCYEMARKVALDVNIPQNCIAKVMEDAKREHAENLVIREQISFMEKLKEGDERLKLILENNPQINILFNPSFEIIDCNPAALSFFEFETKEEFFKGFAERAKGQYPLQREDEKEDNKTISKISRKFLEATEKGAARFDTELAWGGKKKAVNVELKRIPYNETYAIVAFIYDMTDAREREMELIRRGKQLKTAMEEARSANQAKSSFLSTMSHEIRTPLNAIIGITEIQLQTDKLTSEQREALSKIHVSGDMLLRIINDILDLSKIESGKLEIINDKYEIASLISDTAQLNIMRIGSKPIEFTLKVNPNIPFFLYGDELRVKQVFSNLLSNAFKYTDKGFVKWEIDMETTSEDPNGIILVATITDSGQGMTKEQVQMLFEEYARFNLASNRMTEGTGLGMSITRNLIQMMNGSICVESEPGVGSSFVARLPQRIVGEGILGEEMADNLARFKTEVFARATNPDAVSVEPMPYGSVMIVDDVETNVYVAEGLMSAYDLAIDSCSSGKACIDKVIDGNEYDIIFMDHMMPGLDGVETTRLLRASGYSRPIIALTANAVAGQSEMFLKNGFDDFISKPIDSRRLNMLLKKYIRDRAPEKTIEAYRAAAVEFEKNSAKEIKTETKTPKETAINQKVKEVFLRDAKRALEGLEKICETNEYSENDLRSYTIITHGIKSALANAGQGSLSEVAAKLEEYGRDNKLNKIKESTSEFLEKLRDLINDLTPEKSDFSAKDDMSALAPKLNALKEAAFNFNKKGAKNALEELRSMEVSEELDKILYDAAEYLLHSDFDALADLITNFLEKHA